LEIAEALNRRRRWTVLAICCLSLFMVGIDTTIVNLALPAIGRSLHATTAGLQWTIDSYTLVLASLLLSAGALADRLGRRRAFQAGLVLFVLGSLLCSTAPVFGVLIAARVLQAVGGSLLNPVAMSIIRNAFTDAGERARAIGVWGSVIGVSMAVGPVVGGSLLHAFGWRSIFWVNGPVGVVAVLLNRRYLPESRPQQARPFDPIAQLLLFAALASLTFALIEGPQLRWSSPWILLLLLGGLAAASVFVQFELGRKAPLLDVRYFRSAPFAGATLIAAASYSSFGGFLFLNSLYLQQTRGLSALTAAVMSLPMALGTMVTAPLSGRLLGRVGPRFSFACGGVGLSVGSLLMLDVGTRTPIAQLLVAYVVFGVGFGSVNPPINQTAVSGMPPAQAGVAAAVASTSRQVGQTLGGGSAGRRNGDLEPPGGAGRGYRGLAGPRRLRPGRHRGCARHDRALGDGDSGADAGATAGDRMSAPWPRSPPPSGRWLRDGRDRRFAPVTTSPS
jgi:EmrB/QacA subfamily drug resistance transporter